jgi:antitoxin component YwqK of YwqJK toxin-antitoxin module
MFNKYLMTAIVLSFTMFAGCQTKDGGTDKPAPVTNQTEQQTKDQDPPVEQSDNDSVVIKVRYYPSGAVETETEYVNDVRNGMHKLYDEQGNLLSEVKYVNNKMEGTMRTYYSDGTLKVTVPYEKGLANGEMIIYYPDGKVWKRQIYEKGKMLSNKQYTPEGKLEFEDKIK